MSYPTTDKEFVKMLETAAAQKTIYWNQYPYNLGYYHKDGYFSFDCVNLDKAILNGWQPNKTVGYFIKGSQLNRTGDCTEWGLLSQCEYSTNFTKMNCVAVLYKSGHIGNYLGKEVTINGKIYNVIECTTAWGGGVLYSYVDSKGKRYNHKNGTQKGTWTHWGKMTKWLTYHNGNELIYGDSGEEVKKMQTMLIELDYLCGDAGADGDFGNFTLTTLKEFQKNNGLYVDGVYGPITKAKLEELYNNKIIEKIAQEVIEGKWGTGTDRKAKLTAAGYDYTIVQNKVNELVKNSAPKNDYAQSYDQKISRVYTTTSALNLRQGASLQKPVITVIPRGGKVTCYGYHTGDWYYVAYGNYEGFCVKDYLK